MLTDPEGPFLKLEQEINGMGIVLNPAGAGRHIPVIERKIQEVKEHCRCVAAWAPFNIRCKTFIEALVYYVVSRINLVPHKGGVYSSESPRELLTGRKLNYLIDVRVGFGEYCQILKLKLDNTLAPRTEGGIALYPTGNLTGSVYFFMLDTHKIVSRDHFEVLPMPDDVITSK